MKSNKLITYNVVTSVSTSNINTTSISTDLSHTGPRGPKAELPSHHTRHRHFDVHVVLALVYLSVVAVALLSCLPLCCCCCCYSTMNDKIYL